MSDNKIDGIQKLTKEDVEKSRKIVLESINEPTKKNKIINNDKPRQKKVDGILSFKNVLTAKKHSTSTPNYLTPEIKSEIIGESSSPKQTENKTKIIEKKDIKDKQNKNEKKILSKKPKPKRYKKQAPKKEISKTESKINGKNIIKNLRIKLRNFFLIFLILLLSACFTYLIFITIITKLEIDTILTRNIAKYIPIPALITSTGIIDLYQYLDIKNQIILESNFNLQSPENTKLAIIEKIILNNLLKKYHLNDNEYSSKEIIYNQINEKIIYDTEINKVSINRIKKIKQLANDGNFNKIAEKYGDKFGQILITPDNKDDYHYGDELANLNSSEISNIITTLEGYSIYHCRRKENDIMDFDYVFIKNKSLQEYINDSIKNSRMISLID